MAMIGSDEISDRALWSAAAISFFFAALRCQKQAHRLLRETAGSINAGNGGGVAPQAHEIR